jgi:hypothetical protein
MPTFQRLTYALSICLALAACDNASPTIADSPKDPYAHGWEHVMNVTDSNSVSPAFHEVNEELYLTWVQRKEDGYQLRQAAYDNHQFTKATTIANGKDWLVHWADVPNVAGHFSDHHAWLQLKHPGGHHASELKLYRAVGNGWEGPIAVHAPTPVGEHAFASGAAMPGNEFGLIWLQPSADTSLHQTELAFRTFKGAVGGEIQVLDPRVCDCCPTAMASTAQTVVVAYRGRSASDQRDILYQFWDDGQWSGPRPLGKGGWHIDGCPVNGPAIATDGTNVIIVWWTQEDGHPLVQFAVSPDQGRSFSEPSLISSEAPIGQVGIGMGFGGSALMTWLAPVDSTRQAIVTYAHPDDVYDTIAVYPASYKLGRPVVANTPSDDYVVAWTGPSGIHLALHDSRWK